MYKIEGSVGASFNVDEFSSFDECVEEDSGSLIELLFFSVLLVGVAGLIGVIGVL